MRIPSNKVKDIIRFAKQELSSIYDDSEIQSFVFILFEHFLGWSSSKVLLEKETTINESDLLEFNFAIKDLKKHKPIQYITGVTEFYHLKFEVDESTLIPRPETEELVDMIVRNHKNEEASILDIGTGSSCIAVALANFLPLVKVNACDISIKALQKAEQNALQNQVAINFTEFDITSSEINPYNNKTFDVIVSNPPYIRNLEKVDMRKNVLDYEPETALFAPDEDALFFYRHIINFADRHLKPNGNLYLEINEALGQEMLELFPSKKYNAKLIKDINGKERFVHAIAIK